MFRKMLIANRGEIAVRIIQACREMGIQTVALYEAADIRSLHVQLADECALLDGPRGFMNPEGILRIARQKGVDAVHPGYGFLAEQPGFIRACDSAGIGFIGPRAEVMEVLRYKVKTLGAAREAGFPVVEHSPRSFEQASDPELPAEARRLGFPLVVKPCSGGRGSGERLVKSPELLEETVKRVQSAAQALCGDQRVYLEQAIIPAYPVGVQVLGDRHGHFVHLGERQSLLKPGNQKLISESPAPCLQPEQRQRLWKAAVELARLFDCQNACTVEFLVDGSGAFFFTEIKARIQLEHPLTEMLRRVDLVKEQIRLASGEASPTTQAQINSQGWSMLCRVNAEDPWNRYLPSPGHLKLLRFPSGPNVRIDTYVYTGCEVTGRYDPLIAKLAVWGEDREDCLRRMRRAIDEFTITGLHNNLSLLRRVLDSPDFADGSYHSGVKIQTGEAEYSGGVLTRDLAVAAAIYYLRREQNAPATIPERLLSGWHRSSRHIE